MYIKLKMNFSNEFIHSNWINELIFHGYSSPKITFIVTMSLLSSYLVTDLKECCFVTTMNYMKVLEEKESKPGPMSLRG